eukprot:TRINITY_DN7633_c0_g1_i1.p1 TRINITY_DN7633_c0_g1~~TRINITY_DN7633_c0_g1_i1.p1  ORF type:complete len:1320 (-),score=415.67 TRINITY_DN7633_c0_g1_i1:182-4141(-)
MATPRGGSHGQSAPTGFGAVATGVESIVAALQLYDLCKPAGQEQDGPIDLAALTRALEQHVGGSHDVDEILRPLRRENGETAMGNDKVDFLSYWQCIDNFFKEVGGGGLTQEALNNDAGELDTIRGMRRFRDGVLQIWHAQVVKDSISSSKLKDLLDDIREGSDDPAYWEEVMQAVPAQEGFGLSLSEVAEAVCTWLRDVVSEDEDDDDDDKDSEEEQVPRLSIEQGSRISRSRSNSPRAHLADFESRSHASPTLQARNAGINYHRRSSLPNMSELLRERGSHSSSTGSLTRNSFSRSATMRDSLLGFAPANEVTKAQELTEILSSAVQRSGDVTCQRAFSKLQLSLDVIARLQQEKDSDIEELRRSNESLEKRSEQMHEELIAANEVGDDSAEKARRADEYQIKADQLEEEVAELREHLAEAQQDVAQLRFKVEEAEQTVADARKREWQQQDAIESLEEKESNAVGQLGWLRSEMEARSEELESAKKLLEEAQSEKAALASEIKGLKRKSTQEEQEGTSAAMKQEIARLQKELDESRKKEATLRSELDEAQVASTPASAVQVGNEPDEAARAQEIAALREEVAAGAEREADLRLKLDASQDVVKVQAARNANAAEEREKEMAKLREELEAARAAQEELRAKLRTSEEALQFVGGGAAGDENDQEIVKLQQELAAAKVREDELRSKLQAAAEAENKSVDIAVGEEHEQEVATFKDKLAAAQLREDDLRSKLGAAEEALQQSVNNAAAGEESSKEITKLKEALAAAKLSEDDLRSKFTAAEEALQQSGGNAAAAEESAKEVTKLKDELAASKLSEDDARSKLRAAEEALQQSGGNAAAAEESAKEVTKLKDELAASKLSEDDARSKLRAAEEALQRSAAALNAAAVEENVKEVTKLQGDLAAAKRIEDDLRSKLSAAERAEQQALAAASQRSTAFEESEREVVRLREELAAAKVREGDIRAQHRSSISKETLAQGAQIAALEKKVQSQQDQLRRMRVARDEMVAAQQDIPASEDDELSPRHDMVDRQCYFLAAQLRILLRHSQEIEQLLDAAYESQDGSTIADANARRKLSIQRAQEEGKRVFDELSERLYTLEVQKADVDKEVGRLQVQIAELQQQLHTTRGQLLAYKKEPRPSSSATGISSEGFDIGFSAITATSATSDTRSRGSVESPNHRGFLSTSSDAGGFLGGSTRSPTELRSSPKSLNLQQEAASFMARESSSKTRDSKAQRQSTSRHTRQSRSDGRSTEQRQRHIDEEEEDEAWQRRPSQSARRLKSVGPHQPSVRMTGSVAVNHIDRKDKNRVSQRIKDMQAPGQKECELQ